MPAGEIDADRLRPAIRDVVYEEFKVIGIFAEDEAGLRATRLNFEWVDKQRRGDPDLQELLAWVRDRRRVDADMAELLVWVRDRRRLDPDIAELLASLRDDKRRTEENRSEIRKALLGKTAEWIWHIVSAAIVGGVTYFFTSRGH